MAMDSQASGTTQETGTGIADQLRTKASGALSQQKSRATEGLGSVVEAIRQTGRQLGDSNASGIAGYVNNAADSLQRWTETLDRKDIGEIVEDVQRFGRRQPALFVGLTFGAGLLGARFLKSSRENQSYGDASFARSERDTSFSSRVADRDVYTAQRTTGLARDVSYDRDTSSPMVDITSPSIDRTGR